MRKTALVLPLALMTAAITSAERIMPSEIEYVGFFSAPPNQGGENADSWEYGLVGMTLMPDCMGQPDPSPGDGYPGCIGGYGHQNAEQFGVFDIVPPGSQAQQVVPFYEIGAPIAGQLIGTGGSYQYWDVLYDKGENHCRIWWTYGTSYVNIEDDPPFIGYSDCVPGTPNPQGVWDFGEEGMPDNQSDPFHTAKMFQGLSIIPDSIANRHFDGKTMMLGISRRSGTRGGSQGPSLYVRDLSVPAVAPPGPVMDATPLVWYLLTGFVEWWDEPQMDGPVVHWWTKAKATGAEFVAAGDREAVILPWRQPIINPDDYPCSDPFAYRDEDPTTPDPCEVPVCWYGVKECREGPSEGQQPSFWDETSTGQAMPVDCEISDPCGGGTGMHCLSQRPFLIFYDLEDLAAVYRGEQPHHFPQPYAKMPLDNIWQEGATCGAESLGGSTYDSVRNLLYVSQGKGSPGVYIFAVSPTDIFASGMESGTLEDWDVTND